MVGILSKVITIYREEGRAIDEQGYRALMELASTQRPGGPFIAKDTDPSSLEELSALYRTGDDTFTDPKLREDLRKRLLMLGVESKELELPPESESRSAFDRSPFATKLATIVDEGSLRNAKDDVNDIRFAPDHAIRECNDASEPGLKSARADFERAFPNSPITRIRRLIDLKDGLTRALIISSGNYSTGELTRVLDRFGNRLLDHNYRGSY